MERVSGFAGEYFRPKTYYDAYDNRTNLVYGADGTPAARKLAQIEYPNGINEVYDYAPTWIVPVGVSDPIGYAASEYSGIEIRYVDRVTGGEYGSKRKRLVFHKRRDANGQPIAWTRPFKGDLLYRVYSEQCRSLPDLANPSGDQIYSIPVSLDAPDRVRVIEYTYVNGTALVATVGQFTSNPVDDGDRSAKQDLVYYEYQNIGGCARVSREELPLEGIVYNFTYTVYSNVTDQYGQNPVASQVRKDSCGATLTRTLDLLQRITSEIYLPATGPGVASRDGDPLAAGQVEPSAVEINYEYSTSNCACGDRPTAVINVTANRRSDYVYDPVTGLLLEERHPNPTGASDQAITTFNWQPAVPGQVYGAYRLVARTEPDGAVWTHSYSEAPRINAAWGVKPLAATMTSPAVSASTVSPGPLTLHTTFCTSAPVFDANGAQARLVGQVLHQVDADGGVVDFVYDSRGYLAEVVRNLGGGDLEVRSLVVCDTTGEVVSTTTNAGSAKEHLVTISRDGQGRPFSISESTNGVQSEQRLYYDRWDNLCVSLESNKTGTGGAPDDFGPSPRPDVARAWIRNEFHFVGHQLVMSLEDRRSLDRNDSGAIADAVDARFVRSDFSYSPSGLLLSATVGTGATTQFTYDGYGTLYKRVVTDNASGSVTTDRLYVNNALEVTRRVDGLGNAWDLTRNGAGLVTRAADPAIATVPSGYPWPAVQTARKLVYDVAGRVLESQIVLVNGGADTLVRREVSTLDEVGRAYKHAIYDGTGATPVQTLEARFVGASRIDKQTDPAGRFWTRSFDALGRVVEVQDCTSGNPDKVQYEYIPKTDFVLRETRQHWDAAASGGGQYVARMTEYERDSLGRPLQIRVGPQGAQLVHAFSYYSTGETESYTDPSGKVERYLPDASGRLVERFLPGVAPIWNGTTYKDWVGIDCTSELIQTDGLGHTTRTIFDFAGRPRVVMEPGATVMPTAASPHQAFARLMSYDAASRLATVCASEDIEIAMHRDSAGRLLQRRRVVDGNAVNLSVVSWLWCYDNLRYDALGQVTETNSYTLSDDEYIHETIGRDVAGRKLSESYDFIGGVGGPDIVSGFVGGDSYRSTVGIVNGGFPEDLHVRYSPEATGRVAGIEWQVNANGWKPLASYQHEGQSIRRRSMSLALGVPPGGQVPQFDTTYSYDAYGRMSKIEQSFSSAASVDFYFDAASNLVKEVYGKQSGATGDRFAYDEHHRLQTAWMDSNQAHLPTQDSNETFIRKLTYGLDAVHNRTTVAEQAGQGGGTTTTPYSLDSLSNRYGSVGGSTLIYDARGNLTFDGVCYYIYDALNRLTEVYKLEVVGQSGSMASLQSGASSATSEKSFAVHDQSALEFARRQITQRLASQANVVQQAANPALVPARTEHLGLNTVTVMEDGGPTEEEAQMVLKAWYLYDAFNRRVTRWVGDDGVYFYAWDGWQEAQETIYRDQGGSYSGEVKQFVWGEQLDELVSYRRSTDSGLTWSNYYIAEGGAHCPVRVLNEAGAVVEEQEYDPYGRVTYYASGVASAVSQIGNAFAWRGLPVDHETGLVYSRNRYLNVELGRFMSQDPLGVGGDRVSLYSPYAYGSANPLAQSDPLGLQIVQQSITFDGDIGFAGAIDQKTQLRDKPFLAKYMVKGGVGYVSLKVEDGSSEGWYRFTARNTEDPTFLHEYSEAMAAFAGGQVNPWAFEEAQQKLEFAASLVPPVGEAMDLAILLSPDSSLADRVLSGVSLLASLVTGGAAPNYSGFKRGGSLIDDCGRAYSRYAAGGGTRLLNPPIQITPRGLQHVVERHTHSGIARFAGKSKFNAGEDVRALIEAGTQQRIVPQANGRFARTFDVGRDIGLDRATGQQTGWMTIITEADGRLVTAFPGRP